MLFFFLFCFAYAICKPPGYLWHVVSDNCVGSSWEVFHQQVDVSATTFDSVCSSTHLHVHGGHSNTGHIILLRSVLRHKVWSTQLRGHFASLSQPFVFLTPITSPISLLLSCKLVKVIELKGRRRYENISDPACDSLFWNMYSSYREHPMGSDTCLQRSPGSLRGPQQSKNTTTLQRLLAGAQTNRPKRFCPWNKSRLLWSLLLCRHANFFQLYVQRFQPNCFSAQHQVWIHPQFTWMLHWPQKLHLLQLKATHANISNTSEGKSSANLTTVVGKK